MASSSNPSITVLLPVYNAEAFVGEAIESILLQTFTDFELLIINDGSTDGSKKIIESFKDQRIRFVDNEKNIKLIATLNKGIDLAKGKYIARMDADDISLPNRLEMQFRFMENHPDVGICGTGFETFGKEQKVVKYPERDEDIRTMMLYQIPLCHATAILRRKVFINANLFFNSKFLHAEDYELWTRVADYTKLANIQDVLYMVRTHKGSVSQQYKDIQHWNTIQIIKKYFQKVGVNLTDEEVEKFRNIAYSVFPVDKEEVACSEQILFKIVNANRQSNYLPHKQFEEFVSSRWTNICLNATALGWWIYKKAITSHLSGLQHRIPFYRVKLFLKALLRLK